MPYRIDFTDSSDRALDVLVSLGALDVESADGRIAAILPDKVPSATAIAALGVRGVKVSDAIGRDDASVWRLSPRPFTVGRFTIIPHGHAASADAIVIADGAAFGTGLHPTTALCLEILDECESMPARMLDVGTGSGILALAALRRGVERATGLDIDPAALAAAGANARLNGIESRLELLRGGPEGVSGSWPLVMANIRAADVMELAPILVQRIERGGQLVLSGIAQAIAPDVERVYRRLGMTLPIVIERGGWVALAFTPSW